MPERKLKLQPLYFVFFLKFRKVNTFINSKDDGSKKPLYNFIGMNR